MQKKLCIAVLCMVAAASVLFAAGGQDKGNSSGGTPTLKWVLIGNGQPKNYDSWVQKVNAYIEPKIGAKVDVEVISWGDWDTRRNIILTSNEPFDIIFGNDGTFLNDISLGALMDIRQYVDKATALKKLIPADYFRACTVNGKLYGVPTYKDSSMTQYFVWDKAMLDKYGITDYEKINSLADAYPVLEKITQGEKKPSFPLYNAGVYQIFSLYDNIGLGSIGVGVRYDDKSGKVQNVFEAQDIRDQLKVIRKMYQNGIINKDAFTAREVPIPGTICSIAQGWPLATKTMWGPQRNCEAVASQFCPTLLMNSTVQGSINSVSVNSKHPDKAIALLQLINTDTKLRDMFYFGEEGVNFKYVDKNGSKRVERINNDWTMAGYAQATFFNVSLLASDTVDQWAEVKMLNDKAAPSVMLGFQLDTSKFETELANCRQVYESNKAELLTGARDTDAAVADMIKQLKAAGIDTIIAECQKQVNAFLKK